jgi:hypothetical protein
MGAKTAKDMDASYFGVVSGVYAKIYYMADEAELRLALENNSTAPMQNLVVVTRQVTRAGVSETQNSARMVQIKSVQEVVVPLAVGGTGDIEVDYYFSPAQMIMPQEKDYGNEPVMREYLGDTVRFKIKR